MTVVIHNTDAGAPVLTGGVAGSLIAVLDYCLVAGLGWTKPYSGTNKAVYQMPPGTSGRYLRVDDTSTMEGRLVGYESMSTVDLGSGPFPTAAQISGGLYHYRGSSAARPWAFFGSGGFFHLQTHDDTYRKLMSFGDIVKRDPTDLYATYLQADSVPQPSNPSQNMSVFYIGPTSSLTHSMCRAYAGMGGGVPCTITPSFNLNDASSWSWSGYFPLPDPVTGGMTLSKMRLMEGSPLCFRGHVPGLWMAPHTLSSMTANFTIGDIVAGQSGTPLAGRTFEVGQALGTAYGYTFFETSDTWYS